ncbi:hypothetical protein TWF788_011257 [Orbilia oligospora]|uniref:Uncharacterized protein n=1 Tax=Orbilia oligospora TaxID=2813651 RepID=A0A7C8Q1P2_ORBOL|nr:hypothetical protein TWF788_011257 [Orbilia oligospora]
MQRERAEMRRQPTSQTQTRQTTIGIEFSRVDIHSWLVTYRSSIRREILQPSRKEFNSTCSSPKIERKIRKDKNYEDRYAGKRSRRMNSSVLPFFASITTGWGAQAI